MDTAVILQVLGVIEQVGGILIKYGPTVIRDIEGVWSNLMLAIKSATSGTPLSEADRAQIRANLDQIDAQLRVDLDAAIAAVEAAQ